MISSFETPNKKNIITEEQVRNIVNAISPETEITYIEIYDKHNFNYIKEEWQQNEVSVHLKVKTTEGSMSAYELEIFLDKYTGIDWMVDKV